LRAAQPGRAWVSRPGERDMQSVEVGQSLTGIGRVTAILYQNGRWTVQGTSGQINQ
jgi:intracellular multiplication protein IcmG